MKLIFNSSFIFLLLIFLSAQVSAQNISFAGKQALDTYLEEAIQTTHVPGMVALIVNKDGVIYENAFGKMDVAGNKDMTNDAIFRLASMTKPITSVAIMMLIEDGKLSLDDPIAKHTPELSNREVFTSFDLETGQYTSEPAKNEITIRHLLTHTSGLGYGLDSPILAKAMGTDFNATATGLPLLHEPGEEWTYGESTRVLGHLVERISGQDLYLFMSDRIFVPLKMTDTYYDIPASKNSRTVTLHSSNGNELIEAPNPAGVISSPANGDAGLSATASDYSRFIRLLLNAGSLDDSGQLLSNATIKTMADNHTGEVKVRLLPTTNPLISKPFPNGAGVDHYGLGFQITGEQAPFMRPLGSMAWAGAFNTEFWIDMDNGIGAILMMQILPFYDETALTVLAEFERLIYKSLQQ